MNVYEEAHSLERAIKGSDEYRQFKSLKEKIDSDEHLKKMMDDFHGKQLELQAKQMMGQEVTEEATKAIQDLYQIILKDPVAAEYMQAEMRFSVMMQDVYNILGEVVGA